MHVFNVFNKSKKKTCFYVFFYLQINVYFNIYDSVTSLCTHINTPFTRSSKRPANFHKTSSKCIQNTRANCSTFTGNLLDVCWTFAGWCKRGIPVLSW